MSATHKFAYGPGRFMACPCGAEQDLVKRDGKAVRLFRQDPSAQWAETIGACPTCAIVDPMPPAPSPEPADPGTTARLMDVLRRANPGMFEPEVIDGADVDEAAAVVDLSVAFTPVLERDSRTPVDAVELDGGRYRVYGEQTRDVDAATLKVLRARFLLTRAAIVRRLPTMESRDRERVERLFWPRGDVPWVPPAGSPLANLAMTGQPIVTPRQGDGGVDIVAVFRALSTPGGTIPDVCPTISESPGETP